MRKILVILGIVVALVALAVVAVPFLIPAEAIKQRVIAAVEAATGRQVEIVGRMRVTLLPVIGVRAKQVRLSNAPGSKYPRMMTLDGFRVSLQLLPLLHGTIVLDALTLTDPVIHLEIDREGHPNWIFAKTPASAAPPPQDKTAAATSRTVSELRLGTLNLDNGTLTYDDARSGVSERFTDIGAKISLASLDDPLSLKAETTWNDKATSLAVTMANPRAGLNGGTSKATLKLSAPDISFSFDGTAGSKVDGTIDLAIPSVRRLAAWTGAKLSAGDQGFGAFSLKGKVAASGATYALDQISLSLDAIKATGNVTVATGAARPSITGRLAVDTLDLTPYTGQAAGKTKPADAAAVPAPAASGWSDAPIDFAGLKLADLKLDLSANAIRLRRIEIGKSALGITDQAGKLTADLTQISLYGGHGQGRIVLDGADPGNAVAADLKLDNIQAGPLLAAAIDLDRLTGTGSLNLSVTGKAASEKALMRSIDGKGALHLADGSIKGIDIGGLIGNVTSAFTGGGITKFTSLAGTFTATDGIVKNSDLDLQAHIVSVTGAGTVSLPERSVDYRLTPAVSHLSGVTVPIVIAGPWSHPSYRPDLVGALTHTPAAAIGAVDKAGKAGGGLLRGLFGQ